MQIVCHVFTNIQEEVAMLSFPNLSQAEMVEVQVASGWWRCHYSSFEVVGFLLISGSSLSCVHINVDVSECSMALTPSWVQCH